MPTPPLIHAARRFASLGWVAFALSSVGAAPQGAQRPAPPEFTPVDQGVADRTELSGSYRDVGVDLRTPMHFDRVYRVDARSRMLRSMRGFEQGAYARAQGALVAVFPKSAYRQISPGVDIAQVPPGTVFTLAETDRMSRVKDREPHPGTARPGATPLVHRIAQPRVTAPVDVPIEPSSQSADYSLWNDDQYRQKRVAQLLDWAMQSRGVQP